MTPHGRCRLKLLKMERIKDYLLMEEEFIQNQERLKPREEKNEVLLAIPCHVTMIIANRRRGLRSMILEEVQWQLEHWRRSLMRITP